MPYNSMNLQSHRSIVKLSARFRVKMYGKTKIFQDKIIIF